ncbi:alcohol dehydrogenase catalytic domain-containing protein [Paenisporosarcina indica]|uniref:alcohol dehydrogenase catalytic domain-containing protein n=1 Tax=Paenisporosarcina indica TaxID=650093 RepID=UPI000A00C56C|nr:alcohol dehydrogenase catalytic domain-containing protein [Paenisporosarcina indica]
MVKTMRALTFYAPKDLKVVEVPIPVINEDELLVRVSYAGVCGTDNRIYQGTKIIEGPRIIGHEFSGVIEKVGTNVQSFSVGDHVTVYPMISCGDCYTCKTGRKNICVNRKTIGYEIDGGFAQYIKIPKIAINMGNVFKVSSNLDQKVVAITEPIAAALNGIKRANIQQGDCVVIIGAGPIGLFHVQLAKLKEPGILVVIEPDHAKREIALKLGATHTINPFDENPEIRLKELTDGEGADVVIIDVGIPKIIEESIEYVKKGGTYVIFAGAPHGSKISLDPNLIHYKEINLTGSSAATPELHQEVLDLVESGQVDVTLLISEVVGLDEWERALEMKNSFQKIKVIIDPWA